MFIDHRGVLMWTSPSLLNFDYRYLTIGTINPGCCRGGHYHKTKNEKILCVSGEITVLVDNKEYKISSGVVVDIPIGSTHILKNPNENRAVFIEFVDVEYDKENSDIWK